MTKVEKPAKKRSEESALVDAVLGEGSLSSHPLHYNWRRVFYIGCAVLPFILAVLLILVFVVWGVIAVLFELRLTAFCNWLGDTLDWLARVDAILVGLAVFAIGFGTCGLLTVLASRYPTLHARGRLRQDKAWPWWAVLGLAAVLGGIGVFIVHSPSIKLGLMGSAILLLPILLAIFLLGPVLDWANGHGKRGHRVMLAILGVVFGTVVTVWIAGLTQRVGDWVVGLISEDAWKVIVDSNLGPKAEIGDPLYGKDDRFGFVPKEQSEFGRQIGSIVQSLLIILNMVLLVGWLFWRRPEEKKSKKKQTKKRGFFGRIMHAVARAIGLADDAESGADAPVEWLKPLLEADPLPDGCVTISRLSKEARGLGELKCSPPFENSEYRSFFGKVIPSVDQHHALDKFLRGNVRTYSSLVDDDGMGTDDLMVLGSPGSGRMTWIAATALAAAIYRGDKVLILCPSIDVECHEEDDEADEGGPQTVRSIPLKEKIQREIEQTLRNSRVNQLIMVRCMDSRIVNGLEANNLASIPEVMVATPHDIGRAFFNEDRKAPRAKLAALRMLGSILVTDVTDFSAKDKLHLPFLLGKIRLINEVARGSVQVGLMVPGNLDLPMRDMIGDRLISPIRSWRRTREVVLNPWRQPPDEEIVVEVDDTEKAFESIAAFLLERGQSVIVIRRRLDAAELERERSRLLPDGVSPEHLRVVSSLAAVRAIDADQADDAPPHNWCIIMNRATHDDGVGSLNVPIIAGSGQTAVIHLGVPDAIQHEVQIKVPLLGSSRSQGLLVRELATVIPYLPRWSHAHRNFWRQFGIPEIGGLREVSGDENVIKSFTFKVDPPDSEAGMPGVNKASPWIQLQEYDGHHAEVGSVGEHGVAYALRLRTETEMVVVSRDLSSDEKRRVAAWSIDGQSLDTSHLDLAATDTLSLPGRGGQRYLPQSILVDQQSDRTLIQGRRETGTQNEKDCPIWSGHVVVGKNTKENQLAKALPATQGFPSGVRWYHLRRADSRVQPVLCDVAWSLDGYFDAVGGSTRCPDPITFKYQAYASILVLGEYVGEDEPVGSPLGRWTIDGDDDGRTFWPELTAALMAGLRACATDAGRLGRVLAFRSASHPDVAQVLITELPDLSGTLEEMFQLIFHSKILQKQFLAASTACLAKVANAHTDSRSCFRVLACRAGQSMGRFDAPLDSGASQAMQLLRQLEATVADGDEIPMV